MGTLHSPKIQHYRNLTIRLFSVISRTLTRGPTSLKRCSRCILQPQLTGQRAIIKAMVNIQCLFIKQWDWLSNKRNYLLNRKSILSPSKIVRLGSHATTAWLFSALEIVLKVCNWHCFQLVHLLRLVLNTFGMATTEMGFDLGKKETLFL